MLIPAPVCYESAYLMLQVRKAETQDRHYIASRFFKALGATGVADEVIQQQGSEMFERVWSSARRKAAVLCAGEDGSDRNLLLGCVLCLGPLLVAASVSPLLRAAHLDDLLDAVGLPKTPEPISTLLQQGAWLRAMRRINEPNGVVSLIHLL